MNAYLLIVSMTSLKRILEVKVYPWWTIGSPSGPSQQSTKIKNVIQNVTNLYHIFHKLCITIYFSLLVSVKSYIASQHGDLTLPISAPGKVNVLEWSYIVSQHARFCHRPVHALLHWRTDQVNACVCSYIAGQHALLHCWQVLDMKEKPLRNLTKEKVSLSKSR